MEMNVANEPEQKKLPDWVAKLVEETYARGVADGRKEMQDAARSVIGRLRLLPPGMVKAKVA